MRKTVGTLLLAAALSACAPDALFPGTPRNTHLPGGNARPAPADEDAVPPGEHVWMTAVRFPDGFDWELDTCAVEGTVFLDLYRDGERVRSIPAGGSVHPDMHRAVGGHLWADCSTDTETILCRDGKEQFRFGGREALRGFLVREDGVHTLGQDRDGAGFTYRVDGRVVFRSETGTVSGALDRTGPAGGALIQRGDDVFYTCVLPTEKGSEGRIQRNAECHRILEDAGSLLAFGFLDGKVCQVRKMPRRMVLDVDGVETPLSLLGGEGALWCRMVPWRGGVLVLVCATGAGGKRYFLQSSDGSVRKTLGEPATDLVTDGERVGWTVTDSRGGLMQVRWLDGGTTEPGAGASLASGRCILLHGGEVFLAVTGRDQAPNRLIRDGGTTEIPFNGYFTSVVVE